MLICVPLLHFAPIYDGVTPILKARAAVRTEILYGSIGIGTSLLLYPLFGLFADLVFSRFKVILVGCLTMSLGLVGAAVYASVDIFGPNKFGNYPVSLVVGMIVLAAVIGSLGMIDANALQFGMDQLTEASGNQLSKFVHWYFWAMKLSLLIATLISGALLASFMKFFTERQMIDSSIQIIVLEAMIVSAILTFIALLVLFTNRQSIDTARMLGNPLKNIFYVLRYSWKHKCPENRSAFTYWEDDIPKRIDLGKHKYGGPFTNEEVENVKTFFRILFLLLSLFGFQFTDDTFSLSNQLKFQIGCPSNTSLVFVACPFVIPTVFLVIFIPFYQTKAVQSLLKGLRLTMIRRMWLGLLICALQVFCEVLIFRVNHNMQSDSARPLVPANITMFDCFLAQAPNQTLIPPEITNYSDYFYLIIPQFLLGLTELLVFMTALEFICAQAPQTMQGLLIGLWYGTHSIRFILVAILEYFAASKPDFWYIYQTCKGVVIMISLMLYSFAAWRYKKRARDEIINIQHMIEEIHAKYIRADIEQERLLENQNSYGSIQDT